MKPTIRGLLAVAAMALAAVPANPAAAGVPRHGDHGWRATWGTAAQRPNAGVIEQNWSLTGFTRETVRQVVRVSAGGTHVRIRLSNVYGTGQLRLTGATVARGAAGPAVRPGTLRPLTFRSRPSTTIPAGTETVSDPAPLAVPALDRLTVTLYFAAASGPATFHEGGLTTTYRAGGNHLRDPGAAFTGDTSRSWYFLAGIDTTGRGPERGSVVAFGDSITDGYRFTPDANNRYSDDLAERLAATGRPRGVVNAGINGNKLLAGSPCFGDSGLDRFPRDVAGRAGVRTVIVLIGLNDIGGGGFPDFGCGASPTVTPELVITGHRKLIRAAHSQGIRAVGATLPPMKGAVGFDTPEKEAVRDAVNHWIRTGGEYDGIVDVERALADPADPDLLRPAYDSGDHIHPNDAGHAAIAAAVDLTLL